MSTENRENRDGWKRQSEKGKKAVRVGTRETKETEHAVCRYDLHMQEDLLMWMSLPNKMVSSRCGNGVGTGK